MQPSDVAVVMRDTVAWWAVAGGWAIDLWLGTQSRDHHDVEVVVRRCDHAAVHDALAGGWELQCIDPPGSGWRPWHGTMPELPAHQIRARSAPGEFDLFLEDADEHQWRFRRNPSIVRDVEAVLVTTPSGLPVVRPEIQLLYMATSTEPKNEHDFRAALPRLSPAERTWLARSLAVAHPGHRWIADLASA